MFVTKDLTQFIPVIASPVSETEAASLLPMSLAFIGDGVHSLLVRTACTVGTEKSTCELHKEVVAEVCAKNQSVLTKVIAPHLTEIECDIFRRARNAKIHTSAKHAEMSEYRRASGFEAVLGFLYLTGKTERIAHLFSLVNSGGLI